MRKKYNPCFCSRVQITPGNYLQDIIPVCIENLKPYIMVMKPAKDRVEFIDPIR